MFISASTLIAGAQKLKEMKDLHISGIELGYPCPEIPYYHFRADVELPQPSMMEVEVAVDGKVLRAVDLRRKNELNDSNRPLSNHVYSVALHNGSGHLDQITLKSKPDFPLFHRMETNGAVHWNPDIQVLARSIHG